MAEIGHLNLGFSPGGAFKLVFVTVGFKSEFFRVGVVVALHDKRNKTTFSASPGAPPWPCEPVRRSCPCSTAPSRDPTQQSSRIMCSVKRNIR